MNVVLYVEKCLIPKLSTNYDESQRHKEYENRLATLQEHLELVINGLKCANLRQDLPISDKVLSAVLILYKELNSEGPWAPESVGNLSRFANHLSVQLQMSYRIKAEKLLDRTHIFNSQEIFEECMRSLHLKLTSNEFKKYPSLIEVYCSLIEDIEEFQHLIVNLKTMPASLCLIEDYNIDNKKKGLKCCKIILKNLELNGFEGGNYYAVIYLSLKKALQERDIEVTRLVLECLQDLLRLIPIEAEFKTSACDELFAVILEQIQSESSLYRKAALFRFMKYLIEISGVNCVGRRAFQQIICYNLDECCNKGVEDIMLLPILLCLEEWLKHCWCFWQLHSERGVLATLLKLLYTCNNDYVDKTAKITATFITLCKREEQQKIQAQLRENQIKSEQFRKRLSLVNKYIVM